MEFIKENKKQRDTSLGALATILKTLLETFLQQILAQERIIGIY